MRRRIPGRKLRPAAALLAAGLALVAFAAGCARQPATVGASVASCTQFGVDAIRHRVTVTALPPACRGLTRAQVNLAVGSALRFAAGGGTSKFTQRKRIAAASHYLGDLVTTVPPQRSRPPAATAATSQPGQASPVTLGLIALCTWLITIALGLSMMARWILRRDRSQARAGRFRRPPAVNAAHLSLASASLLTWIVYLATRVTGVAWAACALLPLVAGLGMVLVFLPPSASRADRPAADAPPAGTAGRGGRPPAFAVAAHVAFATATILFAVLTAIGIG